MAASSPSILQATWRAGCWARGAEAAPALAPGQTPCRRRAAYAGASALGKNEGLPWSMHEKGCYEHEDFSIFVAVCSLCRWYACKAAGHTMEDWTACNDAVRLKGVGVHVHVYMLLVLECLFEQYGQALCKWEGWGLKRQPGSSARMCMHLRVCKHRCP